VFRFFQGFEKSENSAKELKILEMIGAWGTLQEIALDFECGHFLARKWPFPQHFQYFKN